MFRKHHYIVLALILIVFQANAQIRPMGSGASRQGGSMSEGQENTDEEQVSGKKDNKNKPKIPSVIKVWDLLNHGSLIKPTELDTTLWFYHNYLPFNKKSISNTFTGNNGGAYISNDFFKRTPNSDFYFARSFDAYFLTPSQLSYYNTTTPYTLLDYSQSENRLTHNETRFNVFHSRNVNKNLNFSLIYNQTRSSGQYLNQQNKFHTIGLLTSYRSDRFISHTNVLFNRLQDQENGGLDPGQDLIKTDTDYLTVKITDKAFNKISNNTIFAANEYRVGKTIESEPDTAGNVTETFIPRVGFIHELELSSNKRIFTKDSEETFFKQVLINDQETRDSVKYTRFTNLFQLKFYEAPDRKFTFGKRAYIGYESMLYHASTKWLLMDVQNMNTPSDYSNTFVGGGIFRNEGKFWQWEATGRIYLLGYRAGQTEMNGFINKPLRIGRDTTSLRIEGSLKTLVPEHFEKYFYSNHFQWRNKFNNINEMTIKSSIESKEYKTKIGVNYSLLGNYIYNDTTAVPKQADSELLVVSAYLNKDIERKHWIIRTQLLAQKSSNEHYLHLPVFAGLLSLNYRTVTSKVLYTQFGIDTRYNTAFYADAYEPATARFYLQNKVKIGNYPFVDLHVNLKLKRTRFFFILMNAASGFAGTNYNVAPDYPYYRRTYRIGLAWSFYD
jgi:hypothetical protein